VPVYLSGMARGLLGRDHPLQMRHARRQALREADCVLLAGVPCDFRLDYGRHVRRSATLIAANRSARTRAQPQARRGAIGDAGALPTLADRRAGDRAARDRRTGGATLRAARRRARAEIDGQAAAAATHVNPLALLRALDRAWPRDDAVLVADGGDFVATASYVLRPRGPLSWLDPGRLRHAGRGRGLRARRRLARPGARCGSSSATAPAATAWPSSTPSCATACR
jgi:thiamine pyrophosphate-dependent acetolactate synthase large subunit-like protein